MRKTTARWGQCNNASHFMEDRNEKKKKNTWKRRVQSSYLHPGYFSGENRTESMCHAVADVFTSICPAVLCSRCGASLPQWQAGTLVRFKNDTTGERPHSGIPLHKATPRAPFTQDAVQERQVLKALAKHHNSKGSARPVSEGGLDNSHFRNVQNVDGPRPTGKRKTESVTRASSRNSAPSEHDHHLQCLT